jgi:hypothetical protein
MLEPGFQHSCRKIHNAQNLFIDADHSDGAILLRQNVVYQRYYGSGASKYTATEPIQLTTNTGRPARRFRRLAKAGPGGG